MTEHYTLIQADAIEWMKAMVGLIKSGEIERFHAAFGDGPYFLGSMTKRFGADNAAPAKFGDDGAFQRQSRGFAGMKWDGFDSLISFQTWTTEWAKLLIQLLYPGALIAFYGSPRTSHRLACGLEDAGFEIMDTLMYIHGQGMPKSHNVSKQLDKKAGVERKVIGKSNRGAGASQVKLMNHDTGDTGIGILDGHGKLFDITEPNTIEAKQWDGYGTALKPAYEPIILARAPRGNMTFAQLAVEYGTGLLNINGGRIGTEVTTTTINPLSLAHSNNFGLPGITYPKVGEKENPPGRWPANLAFDADAADELDEQQGIRNGDKRGVLNGKRDGGFFTPGSDSGDSEPNARVYNDKGGVSRYFYTAKPAKWERESGLDELPVGIGMSGTRDQSLLIGSDNIRDNKRHNVHPTVKSIQLNTWLASLLLPPVLNTPRRIINLFGGSGSESIGAHLAGWDEIVAIERQKEYIPINQARSVWWMQFSTYEEARKAAKVKDAPAKEPKKKNMKPVDEAQLTLFDLGNSDDG